MARKYVCDRSREELTEPETSVLRLRGPIASMVNRKELHLSKSQAREFARFMGFACLEPLEPDHPLPLDVSEFNGPAPDADATAADLREALVVKRPRGRREGA